MSIARSGSAEALRAYVLRADLLNRISSRLVEAGCDALLVKGAALALTVYPEPWTRRMNDVDLLVRPGTESVLIALLQEIGCVVRADPLRRTMYFETRLYAPFGGGHILIELHTSLDKYVERPISIELLFERSLPAPGLAGFRVPANEDHLLLLALDSAHDGTRPAERLQDAARLLEAGVDRRAVETRARLFRMETALYVFLEALERNQRSTHGWSPAFRPSAARTVALSISERTLARTSGRPPTPMISWTRGVAKLVRQTALRDDTGAWFVGLSRCSCAALGAWISDLRMDRSPSSPTRVIR
jgi:hypothetical protein